MANLREVDGALDRVGRELRRCIATDDSTSTAALTKLYALTLAVKVESRLNKLAYGPNVSESERTSILAPVQHTERWHASIELGLRKHYAGTKPLDEISLGHDVNARYQTLRAAVDNDLKPLIELRNKLAHGQWVYPLTSGNEIAKSRKLALERENALSLSLKNRLLDQFADVIHDLVVSRKAFELSFEGRFKALSLARQELVERRFENYQRKLRQKKRRGQQFRRQMND